MKLVRKHFLQLQQAAANKAPHLVVELSAGVGVPIFGTERNAHLKNKRTKNDSTQIRDEAKRERRGGVRRADKYIIIYSDTTVCLALTWLEGTS